MSRAIAVVLACLAAGCARPREYAAPAPEGALQCALREAEELGYVRMSGEPGEDFVRVSQRVDPPPSLDLAERPPLPGLDATRPVAQDEPIHNELLLREADGMLRIEVLHAREGDESPDRDGSEADGHAQIILTTCSG